MRRARRTTRLIWGIAIFWCAVIIGLPAVASAQSTPTPDRQMPNVFYGQVPAGGDQATVLVFVHGVNASASYWWTAPNNMYALAFNAGYRTAFVSLSPDNTPNNAAINTNAPVLTAAMPVIVSHFQAPYVYIVSHSKGGLDAQAALALSPAVAFYVKGVFTIATPNQGTELADWAFGPGQPIAASLGLLSPAVFSMQTTVIAQVRQMADGALIKSGIPFFTISGTSFTTPPNPLTVHTGPILASLTGGLPNDGIVTVPRSRLSPLFSADLGQIAVNHFALGIGSFSFPRINAQIQLMESRPEFTRIASEGLAVDGSGNPLPGDRQNSFPWSTQWFRDRLYVGTGRAFMCVDTATADAAYGTHNYPPTIPDVECTPNPEDLPLQAQIWRYTPKNQLWELVYQSPNDVPIEFDADGNPTKFTARDIAFRGMAVFHENGQPGHDRLYVGGINASSLFDTLPAYSDPSVRTYPPPRMLWTDDGVIWNVVPQTPGTFFGDVGIQTEAVKKRGFRSFATLPGANGVNRLFVTLTDLRGVGELLMSTDPSAGDNAWQQVSANADDFPMYTIYAWRNELYATVTIGGNANPTGYGVFRTDAQTPDPADPTHFLFTDVARPGELQRKNFRPDAAISMQEFQGSLYVGSDRPTELIRINPDDTWDLVVGSPRLTTVGFKQPLSGIGKGFNSFFNGHFYSMAVYGGELYLGTWDWSQMLRGTFADGLFNATYGFDLFKTSDGTHWNVISRNGLGDGLNSSVRNLESTHFGLFLGATNPYFGLQMFQDTRTLDLNGDGVVDQQDVDIVANAKKSPATGPDDPRDMDGDGVITQQDAHLLGTQCTYPKCKPGPSQMPGHGPTNLTAQGTSSSVLLSWNGVQGAAQYDVFRADDLALDDVVPPTQGFTLPGGMTITVQDIRNGTFDDYCAANPGDDAICEMVASVESQAAIEKPMHWIGTTTDPSFTDSAPPPAGATYLVAAEDANGHLSESSNIVSAPSDDAAAQP